MSFLHQTVQCNFAEVDSDYLLKACPTDHCTNGTHHCVVTGRTDAARTRLDERVSACVWHTHNTKILCKVADTLIVITEVELYSTPSLRTLARSRAPATQVSALQVTHAKSKVKTSSATCDVWGCSQLGVSRPPPRGSWRWRRQRRLAPPPSTPDTRSRLARTARGQLPDSPVAPDHTR